MGRSCRKNGRQTLRTRALPFKVPLTPFVPTQQGEKISNECTIKIIVFKGSNPLSLISLGLTKLNNNQIV